MTSETAKRACHGTNKTGNPCGSPPLKNSNYCLSHSDAKARESVGFIAANGKAGRKPNPRAVDVLKERLEADIDKVLKPLFDALEAERSVVVGNGPTAHVETVEDIPTRIAAARELLDRAYGKSKQVSEHTVITDSEIERAIRAMEEEMNERDRASSIPGTDRALAGD